MRLPMQASGCGPRSSAPRRVTRGVTPSLGGVMSEDDYYNLHLVSVHKRLCPGLRLCLGDPYPNGVGPTAYPGTRRYKCCELTEACGTAADGAPICV
jgi:hypothetical protein